MDEQPEFRGDRLFTYKATFVSLVIGLVAAAAIGFALVSLSHPLTASKEGVSFSPGAFMLPLAGLLCMIILAWSVFSLPVRMARRQNVVLDPHVWPATGVVALSVVVMGAFFGAILLGWI
ncbi:MAG TPA: hypothetical protein VKQ72_00335 [Aggregatilineales bacterium]|nr:hypothetical protein [Aggregatilineales bacterium]